ncbi:MAG TPA: SDR family NAD(P)-dependent oxidoreductase [Terriglobales bacterium]|nr:SDR family NAD(P)-dependent oxidoreductase [Terriglobales bacterium]
MQSTDHVIIVTGAASGIGRELCRSFARRGSRIGLVDRDKGKLEAFADELRQAGVPCATAAVDVRQREQVHDAVRQIVGALGQADIVITCAGICRASTVDDLKISELEEIVGINFMGMVYVIEAVLPSMLERNSGQIAGISSMAGVRGIPFEPAYSASKAAVGAYLESLRCELRPRGISITTVFPGYVQTPLLDEINGMMGADMSGGKAFTPNAAAARIVEGLERRSSYIYFPRPLGLSVRLSRLMPPRMYDRVMRRMFSRFSISRRGRESISDRT